MTAKKHEKQSKSEFVRSFPYGTPASVIVAAAKKVRVNLSEKCVYHVRSADNARAKARAKRIVKRSPSVTPVVNNVHVSVDAKVDPRVEATLRAAASEIGLSQAIQILTDWRKAVLGKLASA